MPAAGEVLEQVHRAGICQTDIEITKGYMGYRGVLGHEFVGSLPDASRVVGEINAADGTCDTCRRGDVSHSTRRSVLGILKRDGTMAEYLTLPAGNLHRVPEAINGTQAVFVEPLAAALEITDRIHIRPSQRVAVIGDGKLGILVAQVLSAYQTTHKPSYIGLTRCLHYGLSQPGKYADFIRKVWYFPDNFITVRKTEASAAKRRCTRRPAPCGISLVTMRSTRIVVSYAALVR
jgi:Alcohol dehydrogenase GroES-like domain